MDWKEEHAPKIYQLVRDRLPERGEILLLTYTGSRMFGWGGDHYDIDCRGIITCPNWWSDVHHGERLYDCTVENILHALRRVPTYWTFHEDLSEGFYAHKHFDHKTMKSFCCSKHVEHHLHSIKLQISRLTVQQSVRTALHSYRLLLVPLNFLDTGEVVIDALKVNEEHFDGRYEQLLLLRDRYLYRINHELDWDVINNDHKKLLKRLEDTLATKTDEFEQERFDEWVKELGEHFPLEA